MSAFDTPTPAATSAGVMSRRGAIRFVVTFLVLTSILLSAGRYAVNTPTMNWYLFQVARQTSFVLKMIGAGSYVENTAAFAGRADVMRAELRAWRRGENPPAGARVENAQPLSAYELWNYRALRLDRELKIEQAHLALTEPLRRPDVSLHDRYRSFLHELLERLRQSATRDEGPVSVYVAARGVKETVESAGEILKALDTGKTPATISLDTAFQDVDTQLERARVVQRDFLDARVRGLVSQIQDRLGPQVTFVARNDGRDSLRFTFSLVPDCGALPSMTIYFAALLAFPASLRKRLIGLVLGVPILYGINLARLVCLAAIGAWWRSNPDVFEFAHQYVWQAIYVLIVVGVWLLWVEFIVRPGEIWRPNRTSAA